MKKYIIYCIYNAEGSLMGEINYLWKKYTSNFKCSLCDITHKIFFEKLEWKQYVQKVNFRLKTIHLDEQTTDLKRFSKNKTPCVIVENKNSFSVLITDEELGKMNGDVTTFFEVLRKRVDQL
jgi:hypothetical protein